MRALLLGSCLTLIACAEAPSDQAQAEVAGSGGATAGTGGVTSGASGMGGSTALGGSSGSAGATSAGAAGASGAAGAGGMAGLGGSGPEPGPVKHRVMAIEYPGRLVEISADGQKLWEHQTPSLTVMFTVLANGNVFFPHGGTQRGAQEVNRDHQVVWSYQSAAGELLGGERLANGNSLLGEGGPALALELDPGKQVVGSIELSTSETSAHGQIRHLHKLENGNVLVALEGEGAAREYDPQGKTVWEYSGVSKIHEAIRLPSGNTLIGGGESKKVLEVTPGGQIAWQLEPGEVPELGLTWITSIQVLKNGDFLVGNWLGAEGGSGVHAFQITRDKKVVWKLDDHQLLKSATTVTALDD